MLVRWLLYVMAGITIVIGSFVSGVVWWGYHLWRERAHA